jgi:sugar/nucleoside kinase (ribokinase family)
VVITDGPAGAFASDGTARYCVPSYPDPAPPIERTGAGDAFTATLMAALCKGYSLEQEQLVKQWLDQAPAGYSVSKW